MEDKNERAEPILKETLAYIETLDEGIKPFAHSCIWWPILLSSDNIVVPTQYCPKFFILGRGSKNVEQSAHEMPQFRGFFEHLTFDVGRSQVDRSERYNRGLT
jgi:hypothetical protein